ncbi:hypothetical protein Zmor_010492 [Zophobas morio]|uniref:Uncharacterized protein n=1 Tax=Zophobas morio TaxID=2755281 RepID=A0AA38IP60_9CUCU|nr:hypothetical protein Zmor_010492 [Zophobas morio]
MTNRFSHKGEHQQRHREDHVVGTTTIRLRGVLIHDAATKQNQRFACHSISEVNELLNVINKLRLCEQVVHQGTSVLLFAQETALVHIGKKFD